jgi:hypothetical protein
MMKNLTKILFLKYTEILEREKEKKVERTVYIVEEFFQLAKESLK